MLKTRPVTAEDRPGVLSLIGGIYAEYGFTLDPEEDAERHLRAPGPYFRASGGEFWVVEANGDVKATAAVFLHEATAELKALYVHSSLRRQGWGRRLVNIAIEYARRAGKPRMILWSDTRFNEAHSLYRSLGFRECGVRDMHDSNNSIEYGFEITL